MKQARRKEQKGVRVSTDRSSQKNKADNPTINGSKTKKVKVNASTEAPPEQFNRSSAFKASANKKSKRDRQDSHD